MAVLTKINSPYLITKLFELVTLFASWKLKAAHTRKLQIMFLELFMRVASLLQKDSYLHHKMCIGISFQTFFLIEKKILVVRNNCTKHYFLYVPSNFIVIWGKNKIFDWNVIEQSVFWKLIIVLCQGQPLLLFSILVLLLSQRNHLSKSAMKSLNFRYRVYQIKNSIKYGSRI